MIELFRNISKSIEELSNRIRVLEVLARNNIDGWTKSPDAWEYETMTSFTVPRGDAISIFTVGTKIRLKQGGSYKYFRVLSSSIVGGTGDVSVVVTGGGDYYVENLPITDNYFSYQETPREFPFSIANNPIFISCSDSRWVGSSSSPLTSTSWDGDSYSTTAKTSIDLSAVFGVPAGVKAVLVRTAVQDSGASGSDCYLLLSPNNDANIGIPFACFPSNDRWNRTGGQVVPCDSSGDIYYQIVASGASTMDITIQIWGYWL